MLSATGILTPATVGENVGEMRCSFLEMRLQLSMAAAQSAGTYWPLLFPRPEIPLVLGEGEPGGCPGFILPQQFDLSFPGMGSGRTGEGLPTLCLQHIGNGKWTGGWWGSMGKMNSAPSSINPNKHQPSLLIVVLYLLLSFIYSALLRMIILLRKTMKLP